MDAFKNIEIENTQDITKQIQHQEYRTCDYSFGGICMWKFFFHTKYTIYEDVLILKNCDSNNNDYFFYPVGSGNIDKALDYISNYCTSKNNEIAYTAVPKNAVDSLKEKYGEDKVTATFQRDWSDYLYLKNDLIELKGKKYSRVRNHINKFESNFGSYDFDFINDSNIDDIKIYYNEYMESNKTDNIYANYEQNATKEVLSKFFQLNMIGGIIKLGNIIVAMTIGEVVNDTIYIHIEKADRTFNGAYQVINKEFLKHIDEKIMYVNREEDLGIEGIRKAKMSYRPIEILEKYDVYIK